MGSGKYIRTGETRKKMSETRKRLIKEGKVKIFGKGINVNDKIRKKIVESRKRNGTYVAWNKGKPFTSRIIYKGYKPWNKGKSMPERFGKKISLIKKGLKFSDIHKKRISQGLKGVKKSKESIIKRVNTAKKNGSFVGEKNPFYGKKHRDETKILLKQKHKEWIREHPEFIRKFRDMRLNIIFPKKDSSIEIKIQNSLKQLGIEFYTHQYIKEIEHAYQCDIMIPVQKGITQKTIIECDGDYWHGNLNKFNIKKLSKRIRVQRCLDFERTIQLEEMGFKVIRLWGSQIKEIELNKLNEMIICNMG